MIIPPKHSFYFAIVSEKQFREAIEDSRYIPKTYQVLYYKRIGVDKEYVLNWVNPAGVKFTSRLVVIITNMSEWLDIPEFKSTFILSERPLKELLNATNTDKIGATWQKHNSADSPIQHIKSQLSKSQPKLKKKVTRTK